MTTITKEQAQKIIDAADDVISALAGTNDDISPERDAMIHAWDYLNDVAAPPAVVRELARIALASLEDYPAEIDERASFNAWNNEDNLPIAGVGAKNAAWLAWQARSQLTSLSSPVQERDRIRREHAEWSQDTFGDVGPIGPLKHLAKEAMEAAAEPDDLSEWADMQFLLWDAQRRAGISDEQITQAMIEKLAVNKQRQWPKPKDGEPRLHIKPAASQQEVNGNA